MNIHILDTNPNSESARLANCIADDLRKKGILSLPQLNSDERKCIWQSGDKTIQIYLISTGISKGQFLLRQQPKDSEIAYHLRSAEFTY